MFCRSPLLMFSSGKRECFNKLQPCAGKKAGRNTLSQWHIDFHFDPSIRQQKTSEWRDTLVKTRLWFVWFPSLFLQNMTQLRWTVTPNYSQLWAWKTAKFLWQQNKSVFILFYLFVDIVILSGFVPTPAIGCLWFWWFKNLILNKSQSND